MLKFIPNQWVSSEKYSHSSHGHYGGARMYATMLRCAVARADRGGGLWWPELMMEVAFMHV
jgi:hypothetical protein